jgi:hypothetical protein
MIWQVLTEYVVQDLNTNPVLPFQDNTFDVITNVVLELQFIHKMLHAAFCRSLVQYIING